MCSVSTWQSRDELRRRARPGPESALRPRHQPVSTDDAIRALDTAERLTFAVKANAQAEELKKLRIEAQRTVYAEEARSQTRSKR